LIEKEAMDPPLKISFSKGCVCLGDMLSLNRERQSQMYGSSLGKGLAFLQQRLLKGEVNRNMHKNFKGAS